MTRYVRRTYYYDDDGFETPDEIVEVLNHNASKRRLTALVKEPQTVTFEKAAGQSLPKSTYFCNADKDSGGQCEREVNDPDDTCWQHEDE